MSPAGSTVELTAGNLSAGVDPAQGAALLWLRSRDARGESLDWMRPMPTSGGTILDAACFPLVPFSNRIACAEFPYDGKVIKLNPNWPGDMAIHGIGWQRPWLVSEHMAGRLTLELVPEREDWPWRSKATLTYELCPNALSMVLRFENLSSETMPSGLGFHPYFPKTGKTGLAIDCTAVLSTDAEQLPCTLDRTDNVLSGLRSGKLPQVGFDNALTGWRGEAVIDWGREQVMRITANPKTDFAVLYVPQGEAFFCFEPVTHIPNAHNSRDGKMGPDGLVDLAPGEAQTFVVEFEIIEK